LLFLVIFIINIKTARPAIRSKLSRTARQP
jgi:hypothetical protein